jgi:hypothetical protein
MRLIILSVLLGLIATPIAAQEKKPADKPGVIRVETATITATR